ncbi:spondin domain-containing protein [Mangrovibacterium diazotrophicum]|uniref:Spondin N n=1 Tax=Mangrovibacterium diazotrophicum TaxID=1261403 RepID=A0A419W7W5_9BACT|nr:spondin domain-containing protein [Mangrovibacterium diazotrophicum]RKD91563.1 hypothetical protein BC643_1919 [Mangrovibacterium diazotrophicum]
MKVLSFILSVVLLSMLSSCQEKDHAMGQLKGMFTVTVENVSEPYDFFESGAVAIPDDATEAGPATPGNSFTFSFHAGKKHLLSFATMYGISNDLFYAPDGMGIALYDNGTPVEGDITSQVYLWDAGTEVNEEPGVGPNTGPQQSGPNTGPDENGTVRKIADVMDGYTYPPVADNIKVMLTYDGDNMFTVKIDVLSGSSTPISPVAWVVHSAENPLFTENMVDYGDGLEGLAEDGNAPGLADYLAMHSGYVSPVAPVLWVLHHKNEMPIFTEDMPDYGIGLEKLAETGDPSDLFSALEADKYDVGVVNIPEGASEAGPLFPGDMYTFTFEGQPGDYLSIASMLGASNDIFFAFGDMGIPLFASSVALNGDITEYVMLWDAGTEVNEYPGAQTSADTVEGGNVRMLDDGLPWPEADQVIKVTIMKN